MMHGRGKSDPAIVAVKPTNKAEQSAAEPVEPRAGTKGNAGQQSTRRAQSRASVSQSAGPHTASGKGKEEGEVHRAPAPHRHRLARSGVLRTQEDAAPGVDRLTWRITEQDLEATSLICMLGFIGEPTGHRRRAGSTSQRRTADSVRWRLPPWRTRSSNGRWPRCSTRSTRKTSSGSRMGSDRTRRARCAGCARCRDRQHRR